MEHVISHSSVIPIQVSESPVYFQYPCFHITSPFFDQTLTKVSTLYTLQTLNIFRNYPPQSFIFGSSVIHKNCCMHFWVFRHETSFMSIILTGDLLVFYSYFTPIFLTGVVLVLYSYFTVVLLMPYRFMTSTVSNPV